MQKTITTLVVLAVAALAAYIWFAGGQSADAPQRVSAEDRPPVAVVTVHAIERRVARYIVTITAIFANSEGWSWIGPSSNHRVAPNSV